MDTWGAIASAFVIAVVGLGCTAALARRARTTGGAAAAALGITLTDRGQARVGRGRAQFIWCVAPVFVAYLCLFVLAPPNLRPIVLLPGAVVLGGAVPFAFGRRHAPVGPRAALAVTPRLRDAVHPVIIGAVLSGAAIAGALGWWLLSGDRRTVVGMPLDRTDVLIRAVAPALMAALLLGLGGWTWRRAWRATGPDDLATDAAVRADVTNLLAYEAVVVLVMTVPTLASTAERVPGGPTMLATPATALCLAALVGGFLLQQAHLRGLGHRLRLPGPPPEPVPATPTAGEVR